MTRSPYGTLADGREVSLFTLVNANGLRARVCDFGALLVSMETPDRDGNLADLTHGYDTLDGWLENPAYFGATVGRFGNRIANGRFTLDRRTYELATNNDPGGIPCHLHGGTIGFNKALWSAKMIPGGVELSHRSPDGDEGYPGNLDVKVTFRLTDDDELIWQAEAATDAPTVVNVIHHSYWNLSGDPTRPIGDHLLQLQADHFLPNTAGLIPTGEIAAVEGTPFDFTAPTAIGARIGADCEQIKFANGYDQAWVLRPGNGDVRPAARVVEPVSGRTMEILTDQPALHFYAANFLDGSPGKNGVPYELRTAFCLETEAFPDAPNHPSFPSAVLRPGGIYRHTLVHRFSVE